MNDFVLFIFVYFFTTTTSCIIMFYIMIQRIHMLRRKDIFFNYLCKDCMLSVFTETKYGNMLGIVCVLLNIPVLFFIMFFIMDYLKIKQYYKNKGLNIVENKSISLFIHDLIDTHFLNQLTLDAVIFSHHK